MDAELYVKKAALQASKGDFEKAAESMNKVIETGEDMPSVAQAHCFLGEYYFVKQKYEASKEHLEWISDKEEELESDFDDLLNDEIVTAEVLLDLMDRFRLTARE